MATPSYLRHSEILVKNCDFFHTTPAYDAPFAGPVGITIAITFGADIVEWWAYKIVKKVGEYVYWFRHNTQM